MAVEPTVGPRGADRFEVGTLNLIPEPEGVSCFPVEMFEFGAVEDFLQTDPFQLFAQPIN